MGLPDEEVGELRLKVKEYEEVLRLIAESSSSKQSRITAQNALDKMKNK